MPCWTPALPVATQATARESTRAARAAKLATGDTPMCCCGTASLNLAAAAVVVVVVVVVVAAAVEVT